MAPSGWGRPPSEAAAGGLRLRAPRAGATALFPLHAGQEWTFDLTRARTSTVLLRFVPTSRTEAAPLPPLTVAVGAWDAETGRVPVTLTRTVDGARGEERRRQRRARGL
jgi:hypothetical protein